MWKRWRRGYLVFGMALLLLIVGGIVGGCKKRSQGTTESQLTQYIPKDNQGVLTIRQIGAVPRSVDQLLERFEGKTGEYRKYIEAFRYRIGINPLRVSELTMRGLDPKGTVLATRAKVANQHAMIVAASLSTPAKFEQWLKKYLKTKYVANVFQTKKAAGHVVITAYRKSKQKGMRPLLSYCIIGKKALLTWIGGNAAKTTSGAAVLTQLLQQKAAASLAQDPDYKAAKKLVGTGAQIFFYVPKRADIRLHPAAKKAQLAKLRHRVAKLKQRYSFLGNLPTAQLGLLLEKNPLQGTATALRIGAEGLKIQSLWPVPKVVLDPIRRAMPQGGDPAKLLHALPKQAILAIKTGLEPSLLPMLLQQAAARRKLKTEVLLAQLKKYTGLDLQKDIIPLATGRVLFTLDKLDLKHYTRLLQGDLFMLFRMIGFSVVAEVKSPKKLHTALQTLAKTLQFGGHKVKQIKEKGGRIRYMIPAWPGTIAHWTMLGHFFVYGLGADSLQHALNAIQNPSSRMFRDPKQAGALAQPGSSALYLHVENLRGALGSLPGMSRLIATMFISSYHLNRLQALTISARPTNTHISFEASLQLPPKP